MPSVLYCCIGIFWGILMLLENVYLLKNPSKSKQTKFGCSNWLFKLVVRMSWTRYVFVYVMTISQKTYGSNSWLEDSISSAWSGVMKITMIISFLPKFWSCGRLKVPKIENGQCKPWCRTISWYRHTVSNNENRWTRWGSLFCLYWTKNWKKNCRLVHKRLF